MASAEKPLSYEEERQCTIEENKRRMKELGLLDTKESFQNQPMLRKAPIRRVTSNLKLAMETRRSSRAATRLKVDYKEVSMDIGVRRTRGVGRPLLRRGYVSPAAKNEAAVRAGDIKTSYPSFVKAMLKSHTSGGFWLGLPSDFCNINFTKDDIIVLEDEEGLEWECVYLHNKHGLSGGWRGFSLDHDLEDGDAAVFELVTSSRFKVYITRAIGCGETSARKTVAVAKERDYHYVVKSPKTFPVHSLLHKFPKREKGGHYDGRRSSLCKQSKPAKIATKNDRSRYDLSSEDGQESEDVLAERSEDNGHAADGNRGVWNKEESVQSVDDDIQPTRKLKDKIPRPAKKSVKAKQQSLTVNVEDSDEEGSEDEIQPTSTLKEKVPRVTKRPRKSKQQLKVKTDSKPRQITSSRQESSKASMRVVKNDMFVRRAKRKTDIPEVMKETAARQNGEKCNLPPGTRLKPAGVCSIARGSTKRKLPAIFPARKYNFLSGPKSVKVH